MRVTYYIRKNAQVERRHAGHGQGLDLHLADRDQHEVQGPHRSARLGRHPQRQGQRQGRRRSPSRRTTQPGRSLFGYVLPAHALAGTDMLTVWNDCICNPKKGNAPIGNGPFLLTQVRSRLRHHADAEPARLARQAGEARLDRVPLHHEHELRDPGDPLAARSTRSIRSRSLLSPTCVARPASGSSHARRSAVGAHRDPAGCEGQSAGEAEVAPPGPDHGRQPHRGGEGPVRAR